MITPHAIISPRRQPGGTIALHEHLVFGSGEGSKGISSGPLRDVTRAFLGRFNSHTRMARERMKDLSAATVRIGVDDVVELL